MRGVRVPNNTFSRIPRRRPFSTSQNRRDVVDLAFHRHDSPDKENKGPPLIVMHGLFGSQRNNRTMSK